MQSVSIGTVRRGQRIFGPWARGVRRRAGPFALLILASWLAPSGSFAAPATGSRGVSEARMLDFPYPFRAALTVASDTHAGGAAIFEAVHTLINTEDLIRPASPQWTLLFRDPRIGRRPAWRDGIRGFGLPIADSFWLYDPSLGVFDSFDAGRNEPVHHSYLGVDFQTIVDSWIARGWADTLHTPGPGDIPREATRVGLQWLAHRPGRPIRVWSDHSYMSTPCCLTPAKARALVVLARTALRSGLAIVSRLREPRSDVRRTARPALPVLPRGQAVPLYGLVVLFACGAGVCCVTFVTRPARWRAMVASTGALLGLILLFLYAMPLSLAQGSLPNDRYYCADLVRAAGIRYYWLLLDEPGYHAEIPDRLSISEAGGGTAPGLLHIVGLGDGSRVLAFNRTYLGTSGLQSLHLLTEPALEHLLATHGTAILYTHWTNHAQDVFDLEALENLERLGRYYREGRIWVAPTSEILRLHWLRSFLRYESHREGSRMVLRIGDIEDPVNGTLTPTVDDLRDVSFQWATTAPVEVRLAGQSIDPSHLLVRRLEGMQVISITDPGSPARPAARLHRVASDRSGTLAFHQGMAE